MSQVFTIVFFNVLIKSVSTSDTFPDTSRSAGVGFATRQVGNRTKPNLIVTMDDEGTICLKSQSTFKTTEIKFKLNEPFDETTADDRKTRVRKTEQAFTQPDF